MFFREFVGTDLHNPCDPNTNTNSKTNFGYDIDIPFVGSDQKVGESFRPKNFQKSNFDQNCHTSMFLAQGSLLFGNQPKTYLIVDDSLD